MDIKKYCETLKYLKKSQIRYLIKNRLTRGKAAVTEAKAPVKGELALWIPRLDEHPDYLKRFSLEELLNGHVTLLHESEHPVEMTGNTRTNLICGTLTFSIWSS